MDIVGSFCNCYGGEYVSNLVLNVEHAQLAVLVCLRALFCSNTDAVAKREQAKEVHEQYSIISGGSART